MRSAMFPVLLAVIALARAKEPVANNIDNTQNSSVIDLTNNLASKLVDKLFDVRPPSAPGLFPSRHVRIPNLNARLPASFGAGNQLPLSSTSFDGGYITGEEKQSRHQRLVARAHASEAGSTGQLDGSLFNKNGASIRNMFSNKDVGMTPEPSKECVAVFGATGRVGQLVVKSLLDQGYCVKALVRNQTKASKVLPAGVETSNLDLSTASVEQVNTALNSMAATIWCASGFTGNMTSIDRMGMEMLPRAFSSATKSTVPRIVMCSSAGVTRPSWDDKSKKRLVGAADIPIVNLNPGDILNKKVEAEDLLRHSGVPYSIVRPTGLKFNSQDWSPGRPVFSQGDVAVGRTNAQDLADVLVSVLKEPSATGKTFEMLTLQGYPAPRTLSAVLEPLKRDDEGPLDASTVLANYKLLQQLLPGEEQDATKLEMGRSYEQVDRGEVARARGAAPTKREKQLASSVAGPSN